MIFMATALLNEIQLRAMLTPDQLQLDGDSIFNITTSAMHSLLVPDLIDAHEGYLTYSEDISLTANQFMVRIPYRSANSRVRHLYWVSSDGRAQVLDRYEESQTEQLSYQNSTGGDPYGFIIEGNYIHIYPENHCGGTFKIVYPFRPNVIVLEDNCAQITAVDLTTNTLTFAFLPTPYDTTVLYDLVNNLSGNEIINYDITASAVTTSTITFSGDISGAKIGMWVCLANQAPMPMIPEESQTYLIELAVARILQARGLGDLYKLALDRVNIEKERCIKFMSGRIESKPHKVGGRSPFDPRRGWY